MEDAFSRARASLADARTTGTDFETAWATVMADAIADECSSPNGSDADALAATKATWQACFERTAVPSALNEIVAARECTEDPMQGALDGVPTRATLLG